jgi:tetratricopeptide (TPR) repeat protein
VLQFAVDAPGYRYGVLHCHGRSSQQESQLVLTTRDYQQAYLGKTQAQGRDRAAMELILSSNPVLFVGYGMREPDVLRPLREFAAQRQRGASELPLFALLDRNECSELDRLAFQQRLYVDYGVKVIWYPPVSDDTLVETQAPITSEHNLEQAVDELRNQSAEWWNLWRKKPPLRRANFGLFCEDRLMVHHKEAGHPPFSTTSPASSSRHAFLGQPDCSDLLRRWESKSPRPLVVLGSAGQGKGSLGAHIAERWLTDHRTGKAFLATTRFSNDFLSVIHAAHRHFSAPATATAAQSADAAKSPIAALASVVDHRCLLVIGGFERLLLARPATEFAQLEGLRASDRIGDPMTPEVREFLEFVASTQARVVLLSTLWPAGTALTPGNVLIEHLKEVPRSIVSEAFMAVGVSSEFAAQLYSTLNGNAYALAVLLASAPVDASQRGGWLAWLEHVTGQLSVLERSQRPGRAIAVAMLRSCEGRPLHSQVLQTVALITTPIDALTVAAALGEPDGIAAALKELARLRLLVEIEFPKKDPTGTSPLSTRYTAHTLVRSCVLHAIGSYSLGTSEPQRFVLPCYSSEAEETQRTSGAAHRFVASCVNRLLTKGALQPTQPDQQFGQQRQYLRAAFGMIRSRWSAVGLSQLAHLPPDGARSHYEGYQAVLFRLANALRESATSGRPWEFDPSVSPECDRGVLYADELAWLYNELGLAAFIRGLAGNAQTLWLQGLEIGRVTEHDQQGRRFCQSMLNLAMVQIERAHLNDAEAKLETVLRAARSDRDFTTVARAEGFLGWVHHLRGDDARARPLYESAVKELQAPTVRRGRSIFLRYLGDLERRWGDKAEAARNLERSIAVADQGRHLDLVQWTRLSQAALALAERRPHPAAGIENVLDFAVRMGIPKLEAAALQLRAEAALASGDLGHAEAMAHSSLAISSRLGMRLRVTGTLVVLGEIAKAKQQPSTARALLEAAVDLGRGQGYQLRVEQALEALRGLPANVSAIE